MIIQRLIFTALLALSLQRLAACDVDNPPRGFAASMKSLQPKALTPGHTLKLIVQNGYLPDSPVLVRLEVLTTRGERDWALWDADATLSVDQPGLTLSTSQVRLRNGLGTVLLAISGSGDFNLIATVNGLQTNRLMRSLAGATVTAIGGTLPGASSTWSGLMLVTNDVTVPVGHTLTILSNTLVLVNGAAAGTTSPRLIVNGTVNSLGTEDFPITFTSTNMALNWGQIRHISAQPSTYRYTTICKAGRAAGEGHTGTGPMFKMAGSTVTFTGCNISDAVATVITNAIGKIMQADNSNLTFDNCVLARARMGPEIAGTPLLCTNSYIFEMYGADDADGIYLHDAGAAILKISHTVIAVGDDDAIDTLGSKVEIDNTILRNYCDKGVSVLDGSVKVDKALIVDDAHGVSAKSQSSNVTIPMGIDRTTINVTFNGIAVINKYGPQTNVNGIFNVTNTIIRSELSVVTDYNPANFHLRYCDISPAVSGLSNTPANNAALFAIAMSGPGMTTNSPMFANEGAKDFQLLAGSPCIDTGDPATPADPDGSRADMGVYPFFAPAPVLSSPRKMPNGSFQFVLNAYTNRDYLIEASNVLTNWTALKTNLQTSESTLVTDATATNSPQRFYRARVSFTPTVPPPQPPGPATIAFLAYSNIWRFQQATNFDGVAWMTNGFNDSTWSSGAGVLAVPGAGSIAEPVRTTLTLGRITYYFRTAFTIPANVTVTNLTGSHYIDDGAVVYLNGKEAYRYNMGSTNITYASLAASNLSGAPGEVGFALPLTNLVSGVNVLALEVHQSSAGSSDIYMGLKLDGLVSTNAP